jgi:hypothetical protein
MSGTEKWRNFLTNRGIGEESIWKFGLSGDDSRVVIPYVARNGDQTSERWRWLNPSEHGDSKYGGPPGMAVGIFNVRDLFRSPLYITEGEFDTIILSQAGRRAVGVPGGRAFKKAWVWGFCDTDCIVIGDGDKTGRDFASTLSGLLAPVANSVRALSTPEGSDINDLFLRGELDGWMKRYSLS